MEHFKKFCYDNLTGKNLGPKVQKKLFSLFNINRTFDRIKIHHVPLTVLFQPDERLVIFAQSCCTLSSVMKMSMVSQFFLVTLLLLISIDISPCSGYISGTMTQKECEEYFNSKNGFKCYIATTKCPRWLHKKCRRSI
ncbi:unnamed protein product [Rotaria socialis]